MRTLNEEGLAGSGPLQRRHQPRAARLVMDGGETKLFIAASALISFM